MLRPQKAGPPPVNPSPADDFEPPLLTLSRTNARLAGQFLALQTRAGKLVLAELMQRQRDFAKAINSLFLRLTQPFGEPRNAQEMQEIGRRWAELVWLTQNAFTQTWLASPIPEQHGTGQKHRPEPERRVGARVIRFPERRATPPRGS